MLQVASTECRWTAATHLPALQVQEEASREVTVRNTGKYPTQFQWNVTAERLRKLIVAEPPSGLIPPGGSAQVCVTFNKGKALQRELKLAGNTSLQLAIVEPLTDACAHTLPVPVCSPAQKYQCFCPANHAIDTLCCLCRSMCTRY